MMLGGRLAECEYPMEDVWTRVIDAFLERQIPCEFTFHSDSRHLEGPPPRIHFEHAPGSFKFDGTRMGDDACATIVQACDAYVWGLQVGEDFEINHGFAARSLAVELVGALAAVAPNFPDGRNGLEIDYSNETHVLKYGAQYVVSFQFLAPITWVSNEKHRLIGGVNANLQTRSVWESPG